MLPYIPSSSTALSLGISSTHRSASSLPHSSWRLSLQSTVWLSLSRPWSPYPRHEIDPFTPSRSCPSTLQHQLVSSLYQHNRLPTLHSYPSIPVKHLTTSVTIPSVASDLDNIPYSAPSSILISFCKAVLGPFLIRFPILPLLTIDQTHTLIVLLENKLELLSVCLDSSE